MRKGFTLLELIIVTIIIGVLTSLALPQYKKIIEKSRASEGRNALGAIARAQTRYNLQYASYAANIASLDVQFTNAFTKFFQIQDPGFLLCTGITFVGLVSKRTAPVYYLYITDTAQVGCYNDSGTGGCALIDMPVTASCAFP